MSDTPRGVFHWTAGRLAIWWCTAWWRWSWGYCDMGGAHSFAAGPLSLDVEKRGED